MVILIFATPLLWNSNPITWAQSLNPRNKRGRVSLKPSVVDQLGKSCCVKNDSEGGAPTFRTSIRRRNILITPAHVCKHLGGDFCLVSCIIITIHHLRTEAFHLAVSLGAKCSREKIRIAHLLGEVLVHLECARAVVSDEVSHCLGH